MNQTEERHRREGWQRAWDERLDEIDEHIIRFVRERGELSADCLTRLCDEIRLWFDQQVPHLSYDPGWQDAKSEPGLLCRLLEQRFNHLLRENRLYLSVVESPVVEE